MDVKILRIENDEPGVKEMIIEWLMVVMSTNIDNDDHNNPWKLR